MNQYLIKYLKNENSYEGLWGGLPLNFASNIKRILAN